MKKIIASIFYFMLFNALFSRPIITVENSFIDLGRLPQETEKTFSLLVRNSGTSELRLEKVHTPCGCTEAVLSADRIPPEGEARIVVTFDAGKFLGQEQKYIEIASNDRDRPFYRVFFTVEVVQEYVAEPGSGRFGPVVSRLGKQINLSLRRSDGGQCLPEAAGYDDRLFKVSWQPERSADSFQLKVTLELKPGVKPGKLEEAVKFIFPDAPPFTLPVSAEVVEKDFVCEPELVRFSDQAGEVRVILRNHSRLPFTILAIEEENPAFQATARRLAPGSYEILFRLEETDRNFFDTVKVLTDVPAEPEVLLRIIR